MLQACLNGARAPDCKARVPVTPEDLATDANAVRAAGADELHVHPRNENGAETLSAGDVAAALDAIRAAVPGMPVGIRTGTWIAPGGRARHAEMMRWTVLPDYVSINLLEEDAADVMALAASRGIGIEAGLWSLEDARAFLALDPRPKVLQILVEMPDTSPDKALAEADAITKIINDAGITAPVLLHGEDVSAWPCINMAAQRGYQTRTGFEDILTLPGGSPAPDNTALVLAAKAICAAQGSSG